MIETIVQELLTILALVTDGRCGCASDMVWREENLVAGLAQPCTEPSA